MRFKVDKSQTEEKPELILTLVSDEDVYTTKYFSEVEEQITINEPGEADKGSFLI